MDAYLDVLVLGLTIAAIGVLGFAVYFNDSQSATNRTFLWFAASAIAWGIINYAAYQAPSAEASLWLWRLVLFTATIFCLTIYELAVVFPESTRTMSRKHRFLVLPFVGVVALLTLTPYVFERLVTTPEIGVVPVIQNGPLIPLFGLTVFGLVCSAVYSFIKKARAGGELKLQVIFIMGGTAITFALLIICNFVLPTVFQQYALIPYGAVFILPFVGSTAYAIARYHLFNLRALAAELFSFLLTVSTLLQIIFSADFTEFVFHVSVFVLVLAFSILLVRTVIREVQQKEEIEKLSQEKSEFMTFASHEIRNPITAMRGFASLIVDGTAGEVSEKVLDITQKILINGDTVLALISDFLNKSKLELGQIAYDIVDTDLGKTVSSIGEGFKSHAKEKGLELDIKIDFPGLMAKADEAKLREVVGNLVDNSIKYTKTGSVTIGVEKRNGMARVIVSDTGVGIPPETIAHLFHKFSRADAQKMNLLGTGLGLYLAKTFIEGMGGKIWAESDGPNKGSRFIIELHTV